MWTIGKVRIELSHDDLFQDWVIEMIYFRFIKLYQYCSRNLARPLERNTFLPFPKWNIRFTKNKSVRNRIMSFLVVSLFQLFLFTNALNNTWSLVPRLIYYPRHGSSSRRLGIRSPWNILGWKAGYYTYSTL